LRIKNKIELYDFDDFAQHLLYDINTLPKFNDPKHPNYKYLPKGYAPAHRDISWISYAFSKRTYSYMDVCSKYGLKLISGRDEFRDRIRYSMDDWFKEYQECRNTLINKGLQDFEPDEGPNTQDFSKKCNVCNTFYVAAQRAGLDVFDIGIALGFYPRNPKRSYKNYVITDYITLLKEELNSGLREELGLYEDEAPRLTSLKHERSWLWAAILRSDYIYTDLVRAAGLKLFLDDEGLRGLNGNYIHEITGVKVIEYTRNLGILSFKEAHPSAIDNLNAIDILLVRHDNFIHQIENKQNIIFLPRDIHLICIDITISRDINFIIEKFYKGYQGPEKFLIVVVFEDQFINIQIPYDVKYRDNIRIITIEDYANFLSPNNNGEIMNFFKYLRFLVESIKRFDDDHFAQLEELYKRAKQRLKLLQKRYGFRQKDLEIFLKKNRLYNLLRMPQ